MKIGMIGTDKIGFSLGPLLVRSGHEVKFGSRNPDLVRGTVGGFGPGASLPPVRAAGDR